jgi:hypothetical protein
MLKCTLSTCCMYIFSVLLLVAQIASCYRRLQSVNRLYKCNVAPECKVVQAAVEAVHSVFP